MGPEPIVINGVITYNPYKWPYKWLFLELFHPTYRGYFTPLITSDGAHLVMECSVAIFSAVQVGELFPKDPMS